MMWIDKIISTILAYIWRQEFSLSVLPGSMASSKVIQNGRWKLVFVEVLSIEAKFFSYPKNSDLAI